MDPFLYMSKISHTSSGVHMRSPLKAGRGIPPAETRRSFEEFHFRDGMEKWQKTETQLKTRKLMSGVKPKENARKKLERNRKRSGKRGRTRVASLSFCCLQAVLPMPAALKQSRRSRRSRRSWQSSESRTFTVVTCSHNVVILEWLQVLALEGLRLLQNRTDGIAFFLGGRKSRLPPTEGAFFYAICFSPVQFGKTMVTPLEAIQKLNAATPESMETVQKELEETMKLHLEALYPACSTPWNIAYMLLAVFLTRKLAARRITWKARRTNTWNRPRRGLNSSTRCPGTSTVAAMGCILLHFAAWHVMADTSGEKESAGKEGSGWEAPPRAGIPSQGTIFFVRAKRAWLLQPGTLWLCQHSYWKWPLIVSFPIKNGDFP